ncbi:MAG: hypothetical protein HY390_02245 [Deltaproteobacteria bacterium]|nr:hypothetical protein [Deltaproteobacteria bacterium]
MKKIKFGLTGMICMGITFLATSLYANEVQYFLGTVHVAMFHGGSKMLAFEYQSLVKREILEESSKIIETVTFPKEPNNPKSDYGTIVTTLIQKEKGSTFTVSDDLGYFTGEITFEGTPWHWERWTYELTMNDEVKSKVTGNGVISADGLQTHKKIDSETYQLEMDEDLDTIDEATYLKTLEAWIKK